MNCDRFRIAFSATLDGEDPGETEASIQHHLRSCVRCRAFANDAQNLHRAIRVHTAVDVPDLTAPILLATSRPGPEARTRGLRLGLLVIALVQIASAAPALLLGSEPGSSMHSARHVGAFGFALGFGFLVAALNPARAPGILVVAAAVVACVFAAMLADIAAGRTTVTNELNHANEFIGVALLWTLEPRRPGLRLRAS